MSVNANGTRKQKLLENLSRFLDKYNNPVLGAAEQSELYAMVFREAGHKARLITGHVWVPHKRNRPPFDVDRLDYNSNFCAYRLQNHVWVKVEPMVVDLRLRRVLGSEHPSIPNGVFEPMIYQSYRYHEMAEVKLYTIRDRIEELYHCSDLSDLTEKPKHPRI